MPALFHRVKLDKQDQVNHDPIQSQEPQSLIVILKYVKTFQLFSDFKLYKFIFIKKDCVNRYIFKILC